VPIAPKFLRKGYSVVYSFFSTFVFFIEFDIKGHKVLFEDRCINGKKRQIQFDGIPFVVLGTKSYDCVHGVDRAISRKRKQKKEHIQQKVRIILILTTLLILAGTNFGGFGLMKSAKINPRQN